MEKKRRFSIDKYLKDEQFMVEMKRDNKPFRELYKDIVLENVFPFYRAVLSGTLVGEALQECLFSGLIGDDLKAAWLEINTNFVEHHTGDSGFDEAYLSKLAGDQLEIVNKKRERGFVDADDIVVLRVESYSKRYIVSAVKEYDCSGKVFYMLMLSEIDLDGNDKGNVQKLVAAEKTQESLGCYIIG